MTEQLIDSEAALRQLVTELRDSEWLALDTEFIREKTFYARLCLIQISNGDLHVCVDPLAIEDLSPLVDLLCDERIVKVFHAARQDLEIFLHDWKRIPLPLFDTQPAAALLGLGDQVGYAKLVKQMLDVDLAKDQSRTDWARRPLAPDQLRYAYDDVIYLGQLYKRIHAALAERGRLPWLVADFAALGDPATYIQAPASAWKRVKGRQRLKGRDLAVLQALAAWREERATGQDLPRKWVLKDEVLIDLARRQPTRIAQLESIRGLEAGQIRRDGEKLLELIAAAASLPQQDWPQEAKRPQPLSPAREAQVDLLSSALRLLAARHELSPSAIATRKDIEQLVRGAEDAVLASGWRHELAGATLSRVMEGKTMVRSDISGASLIESPQDES